MIEQERAPVGNDDEEQQIFQMVGISPGKVIIIILKRSLEVGMVIIIKISGGIRPWMFAMRGGILSRQVIWIGGNWGTMVLIARRGIS